MIYRVALRQPSASVSAGTPAVRPARHFAFSISHSPPGSCNHFFTGSNELMDAAQRQIK